MTKDERVARLAAVLKAHASEWMKTRGEFPSRGEHLVIEALSVGMAELVLMSEAEREELIANCVDDGKGGVEC